MTPTPRSLDLATLARAYDDGLDPAILAIHCLERAHAQRDSAVWITLRDPDAILADVAALKERDRADMPLWGVPFAVKDNIDVAGLPTTAACPEFAYVPEVDASSVRLLREAGAILIGKTNLDQFATGLVGVRSPYGACRNAFDPDLVSGGSSAGSGVAVAAGVVSLSLGTDTAGSGRVPAAFGNIVGWKGTRGLVSTAGVIPACRSLDCVTVFALTCADAAKAAAVVGSFDPGDPFARPAPHPVSPTLPAAPARLRLGVPRAEDLAVLPPDEAALFESAVSRMVESGALITTVDLSPYLEAARLLYDGPWVAERLAAVGDFLAAHPGVGHPVVRGIVESGARFSAADAYRAQYRLREIARIVEPVWNSLDAIITPTAPRLPSIAEVEADPVRVNSLMGTYTNFMNLLDLAAVAVPAGFTGTGAPFGVTFFAPAFADSFLLSIGDVAHRAAGTPLGATGQPMPKADSRAHPAAGHTLVAVFGAHLTGLPLNGDLTGRGGRFVETTTTAPFYRFHALNGDGPARPGLVRVGTGDANGCAIATEIWSLPTAALGSFMETIPAPLGLGRVELADGRMVIGFLCEPYALADATDISHLGGWRAFIAEALPSP